MQEVLDFIVQMSEKFPLIVTVISILGTARLIFKPIMSAVEQIVADTESKKDDEWIAALKNNWFYKAFVWLVDFAFSIKLPKAK